MTDRAERLGAHVARSGGNPAGADLQDVDGIDAGFLELLQLIGQPAAVGEAIEPNPVSRGTGLPGRVGEAGSQLVRPELFRASWRARVRDGHGAQQQSGTRGD